MTPEPFGPLRAALARAGAPSSDYDLNPSTALPANRRLRDAAVLVAVTDSAQGPQVILTKRASHLRHHPGQIAFAGGRRDDADPNLTATALREAHEEIGLLPAQATILGQLPAHETVTGYQVTPIVAQISPAFAPQSDPSEVAEVFRVPLAHLTDPAQYRIEQRLWRGTWRRFYVVPWGPYYIWGATARILRSLADRMAHAHHG